MAKEGQTAQMGTDQDGMAPDSSAADSRFPPPEEAADLDERLNQELNAVHYYLGLYLMRNYGVDAGLDEPTPVTEEQELADCLSSAAEAIRARAARRERQVGDRR